MVNCNKKGIHVVNNNKILNKNKNQKLKRKWRSISGLELHLGSMMKKKWMKRTIKDSNNNKHMMMTSKCKRKLTRRKRKRNSQCQLKSVHLLERKRPPRLKPHLKQVKLQQHRGNQEPQAVENQQPVKEAVNHLPKQHY